MRKTGTREYITQALFELLDKKAMKDITVCELVARDCLKNKYCTSRV